MSTGPEPKEQNTNPAEQPGTPETVTYPALGTRYSMQSHVWANIYVEDETVKCRTCNEQGFVTLRGDLNINPTKYPCPVCLGNVNVLQGKLTPKKARVIAITLLRDGRIIYEIAGVYEKFTGRYQESDLYKSREDAEAVLAISKETTRIFSVADMQNVEISARVIWVNKKGTNNTDKDAGMALEFVDPSKELQEMILKLINRVAVLEM